MRSIYTIVLIMSALVLTSCKKDTIEIIESNDPVFRVTGTFDGESLNLVAGDDGAFMHTMTKVENGVNVFSGIISNETLSFEVGIFDGDLDKPSSEPISMNIAPVYSLVSPLPMAILSKNVFQNAVSIDYIRWFVDGIDRDTNDVSIYGAGQYNVCAEVHFLDGMEKTFCNEIILGFKHNVSYEVQTSLLGGGVVRALIENSSSPVTSVEWYVNDVLTQTSNIFELYLPNSPQKLTSKVHFLNGTVKIRSMLVNGYNAQKKVEDFTVFEIQSEAFVSHDFNIRVNIIKNGETYRSDMTDNLESSVQITEIKHFGLNGAGKNVYKIAGQIVCKERKTGTTTDADLNVNFVFGIEIP